MNIEIFVLGYLETNCYLVWNDKEAVVFDPADHPDLILDFLKSKNLELKYVINTHAHFDHILGNNFLLSNTNAELVINKYDSEFLTNPFYNLSAYMTKPYYSKPSTVLVDDNTVLEVGGEKFICIHTPGHTPGSSCFYFENKNVIFTGDTLFKFSFGRTDFVGGNEKLLIESLKKLFNILKDDDLCFPGHGDSFKFGEVKEWLKNLLNV